MDKKLDKIRASGENAGFATISAIRRIALHGSRMLILIIGGTGMAVLGFCLGLIRLEERE